MRELTTRELELVDGGLTPIVVGAVGLGVLLYFALCAE